MNAALSAGNLELKRAHVSVPMVRRTFIVKLEHGLHARPCAMLVKTLQPYRLSADVEANGAKASGTSILGLMTLAAGYGSAVTFTITGEHAHQAMADVEQLFATNFQAAFEKSR
jgi:phosphotransferase system HPr (HPr) family protein